MSKVVDLEKAPVLCHWGRHVWLGQDYNETPGMADPRNGGPKPLFRVPTTPGILLMGFEVIASLYPIHSSIPM